MSTSSTTDPAAAELAVPPQAAPAGAPVAGEAHGASARARLRADVAVAAQIVPPLWPIETFIAVNPLSGLEDQPFEVAVARAGDALGARGYLDETEFRSAHREGRIDDADLLAALRRRHPEVVAGAPVRLGGLRLEPDAVLRADLLHGEPVPPPVRRLCVLSELLQPDAAELVDVRSSAWTSAYLGGEASGWPMPGRERGFYAAWRDLARRDPALPRAARARLRELPERPEDAALSGLALLGLAHLPREHRVAYLTAHLTRQPGWAAHVRWRSEHERGIDLVQYLAVRLTYEAALLADHPACASGLAPWRRPEPAPQPADGWRRAAHLARALGVAQDVTAEQLARAAELLDRFPARARGQVWLDAYERHYRDRLLDQLSRPRSSPAQGRPAAHVVCCIDVRSEGLRRHLEAVGPYETLGFAGFFAVAIEFGDLAGGSMSAQCPVLVEPHTRIVEQAAPGAEPEAERRVAGLRRVARLWECFHAAKDDVAAPFALAEASGWAAGPLALTRTMAAGTYGRLRARLANAAAPPARTRLSVTEGFSASDQALFAEVALRMMGLTADFGRLVVLCGHGSRTENNPFRSSLDCGACGGNRGGPNARTAASILNAGHVREHLATVGLPIPADTWFVAAEHDTANDVVHLLDRHLVPATHRDELDRLAEDLARAGAALSAERCAALPGAPGRPSPSRARRHVRGRSTDWAQVFPEWGLAGNAAFVVAPRSVTAGLDLQRRTFLHSYVAAADPDGSALETILTAPLVVAQWINCQYYFSTVEPDIFGAGTKTIHNVVGGFGVVSGPLGDLRTGLPLQSVRLGGRLVHEPMRLLAVVEAPLPRIDEIIGRNPVLQRLFGNEWVTLVARASADQAWMHHHPPHGWIPWTSRMEGQA